MSSTVPDDGQAVRRKRPAKPQFTQTILVLEAVLVFFATLVAYGLRLAEPAAIWWVGGSLSVVLILLSGLMSRPGRLRGRVGRAGARAGRAGSSSR